jgi:hypothetical protein
VITSDGRGRFTVSRATALLALLPAIALLAAGCGSTPRQSSRAPSADPIGPSAAASASSSPVPSEADPSHSLPSAAPSEAGIATPDPIALPERPSIAVGDLVVVVTDDLRVRSKPRVAADSTKYEPVLGYGSDLSILAGPVGASGYWWYRVHLEDGFELRNGLTVGWVAAGDHDGEAWIEVTDGGLDGPDTDPVEEFQLPVPIVRPAGGEDYEVDGVPYTRYVLSVVNWQEYPDWLFESEPDLASCGANASASRTWVDIRDAATDEPLNAFCSLSMPQDLLRIWFAVRRGEPVPASVYVSVSDRFSGSVASSERIAPAPPPASPRPS